MTDSRVQGEHFKVLIDCSVREGAPTTSSFICNLKADTEVIVTHKSGRRAYLISPVEGWCSLTKANGERILESIDEQNRLIKKNIQLATLTPHKAKIVRRRRRRPQKQKFENRLEHFRQRLVIADCDIKSEDVKYIGGLAVETSSFSQRNAVISLIIISCEDMEVVLEETECVNLNDSYAAGHKEFGQAIAAVKFYEESLSKLENRKFAPQILFVAAAGIYHPRKFGLACHIGLRLQVPTIGVETSLSPHPGVKMEELTEKVKELKSGKFEITDGELKSVGIVLKISDEQLYAISPGDMLSISTAGTLFEKHFENNPALAAASNVSRVLNKLEEKNRLLKKLRQSPASSPQTPDFC